MSTDLSFVPAARLSRRMSHLATLGRAQAYGAIEAHVLSLLQESATRTRSSPWGHWSRLMGGSLDLRVNEQNLSVAIDPTGPWWPAAAQFDLGAPLSDWHWLDAVVDDARIRDLIDAVAGTDDQRCDWVLRRLRNAVRSNKPLVARARAQIRAALPVPSEVAVLAHRTRLDLSQCGFTASHLTRVWRWRSALERVQRESPSLLRIVMAAIEAEIVDEPGPDLIAHLKRHLRSQAGWSQRFWALVSRTDGFFDVPLALRHGSSTALQIIANYGRTLDAASVRSPPHPLVAEALIRSQAGPLMSPASFDEDWFKGNCSLLRLALQEAAHARGDLDRFLRDEFHPFLRWTCATRSENLESRNLGGGWPHVRRLQDRYHRRVRASAAGLRWSSAVGAFRCNGLDVVPLVCCADLFDEGETMRNCLAVRSDLAEHCVAGELQLFSTRRDGKRIGTISIVRCPFIDMFTVGEVRGKANADVSDVVVSVAQQLCRRYNDIVARGLGSTARSAAAQRT